MYNFIYSVWYFFVGAPIKKKMVIYDTVNFIEPTDLKFGLLQNGDYLYKYFVNDVIYYFWGDFLYHYQNRFIETYLERILIKTHYNNLETGFEILINQIDWVWRHDTFYHWFQDWGDEIVLAINGMGFDLINNILCWYIAFIYIFVIYWNNYWTFGRKPHLINFFEVFHQTEDQYLDYYQQTGKVSYNFFEDGFHIIPNYTAGDYDWMSVCDQDYEDHEYIDPSDFCEHPSEESDRFLDHMFDARAYVHYDLIDSLLDGSSIYRHAKGENRLDNIDILNGFEITSLVSCFWWDDYDAAACSDTYDQYPLQFKESRERCRHPYFFYHPLEHYNGHVDLWFMMEFTWTYEPWLEDYFSIQMRSDLLIEEFIFILILDDDSVEEMVDDIAEENDYDYMDVEGISLENNDLDQLVYLPLWRENNLILSVNSDGNSFYRQWMPTVDWTLSYEPEPWDWEDWEEFYDEGSDGMFSDNDATLEDVYLTTVMSNDIFFENPNNDIFGGALPFADINDELTDLYVELPTEFFFKDLLESFSPYGRNEERLYNDTFKLALDYSYVPVDRLLYNVNVWEFGNVIDIVSGELLLDVASLTKESYGLLKTSVFQLALINIGLQDIVNGVIPEYPIRWNTVNLVYEVYNLETYTWVVVDEVVRYLVLDVELQYLNRKYLLGYSLVSLVKWSMINITFSKTTNLVLLLKFYLGISYKEYIYSFIIYIYTYIYSFIDVLKTILLLLSGFSKLVYLDLFFKAITIFFKGKFYSNFLGLDLLAYDKDYLNNLYKTKCSFRLEMETLSQIEELYPSWWVRQGIFDVDFYMLQLYSFDPRNPEYFWYDRAEVTTYPAIGLAGCGNLDMMDIGNSEYLATSRKYDPLLAVSFSLDIKYYDYIVPAGIYERDPSQWAN